MARGQHARNYDFDFEEKRKINRATDKAILDKSDMFTARNINGVLPKDFKLFEPWDKLSGKGFEQMWRYLDKLIKIALERVTSTPRSVIQSSQVKVNRSNNNKVKNCFLHMRKY